MIPHASCKGKDSKTTLALPLSTEIEELKIVFGFMSTVSSWSGILSTFTIALFEKEAGRLLSLRFTHTKFSSGAVFWRVCPNKTEIVSEAEIEANGTIAELSLAAATLPLTFSA
ncbi:MAG: hypothetical protein ACE5G1_17700 [bacterium]